jgi:hypothetical protein
VQPGATEEAVVELLGHPTIKERAPDGIDTWIWIRRPPFGHSTAFTFPFRDGKVIAEPRNDPAPVKPVAPETQVAEEPPPVRSPVIVAAPEAKHEKASEEIRREQEVAVAERGPREREEKERVDPPLYAPPLAAWYMSRQFVTERLAPKKTLFPNPRFAPDLTGEERIDGNTWRTWGYVDTVDSSNAPVRRNWTVELEFLGRGRWKKKEVAVDDR